MLRRLFYSPACVIGVALVLWPALSSAQQSAIGGTVKDPTGAVLAGAQVTIINVNTGEVRQATSNVVGHYVVPNLPVGVYKVSAEKQGFRRGVVDQVNLDVQQVRTVDLALTVGSVSNEVNVTAAPAALQTTESSVSTFYETKVVNELPLNGRDFLQLQLLSPGTTMGVGGTWSAVQIASQNNSIGGGNFSVNGMRDVYNDYILDGISFKDWMHGTNGMNPSVDAVQEFRLQTGNYSAEFGANAGGLVNMVTRSGSNQFHGTLFEFLRNDVFDAANYFTNFTGEQKTPLRRNQFGGTLGGPIRHDKSFFFFSYEGFREQRASTLIDTFPTAKMRTGNFSELLNQPTPTVIHDPATGLPFPGNIIPSDRLLSVMPGYLQKYEPLPNRPGLVNNYVAPGPHGNDVDQYLGRVDQILSNKMQLSGHYVFSTIHDSPPNSNPNFQVKQRNFDHNVSVQLTDTLNSATVLNVRLGYNLFKQFVVQNHQGTTPDIAADVLGIQGVSQNPLASDAPIFIASGFGLLGGFNSSPRQWFSERYEAHGSISLVRGNHFLRTGMDVVRHHETFQEIFLPNGFYNFDGSLTGYSLADMLIGIPQEVQLSPELFDPQFRQWELMPWVQDDWRVTPDKPGFAVRMASVARIQTQYHLQHRSPSGRWTGFNRAFRSMRTAAGAAWLLDVRSDVTVFNS
jgi:hypothetical protein